MKKIFFTFVILIFVVCPVVAAMKTTPNKFINKSLYDNVYPSTINDVRQIPLVEKQNANSQNKTNMGKRRIVKRTNNARAATSTSSTNKRRVVPRSNTVRSGTVSTRQFGRKSGNNNVMVRGANKTATRYNGINTSRNTSSYSSGSAVSSQRCFANYKECMESYCERTDTAYNRCYCSAKLAQIDSKYQNKIDGLIQQIIKLKYDFDATDDEIREYWDETVGKYTNDNPWVNIDNALNINWADTESRVRGQNAFNTGHSYCVRNLKSCSSMATNMRDAYRSEIARDCETYEKSLQKIQSAAESVIESYND